MLSTSMANSSGLPRRWGNGMDLARKARTLSGSAARRGVSNSPKIMAYLRSKRFKLYWEMQIIKIIYVILKYNFVWCNLPGAMVHTLIP
jgi:hypothetical protein